MNADTLNQDERYGFYDVDLFDCPPFVMFSANDCPRARDILEHKSFEPMSMQLWCKLANEATAILDIGAHVGVYSLAAASLRRDLQIHAFEPNPYAFARLRVHKIINGFNNIQEHREAVSHATHGAAVFSWYLKQTLQISSGGSLGSRHTRNGMPPEHVYVPTLALDESPLRNGLGPRVLMKIDVEGGEAGVFDGARDMIRHYKPDIIVETFDPGNAARIGNALAAAGGGYCVYRILEDERKLCPLDKPEAADPAGKDFNLLLTTRPATFF